jgi:hypothetical protein
MQLGVWKTSCNLQRWIRVIFYDMLMRALICRFNFLGYVWQYLLLFCFVVLNIKYLTVMWNGFATDISWKAKSSSSTWRRSRERRAKELALPKFFESHSCIIWISFLMTFVSSPVDIEIKLRRTILPEDFFLFYVWLLNRKIIIAFCCD